MTETGPPATPDAPLVRRVWRAAASVVMWLGVAAAAWLLWPTNLGGCTTLTIVSGESMEPTYQTGDLVVTRCGQPAVGDVVLYEPVDQGGGRIIHRLVGGDGESGWQVQGDNNTWVDPFVPTDAEVLGIARLHVPRLGMVATILATPFVWGSLLVIALAVLVWPRGEDDEEPAEDGASDEASDEASVDPEAAADREPAADPAYPAAPAGADPALATAGRLP
ncbi:S24/S26 family peptidase [Cellulomonas fengjieae]|uniref:S24/S26 family peptidase n=1 Tax=Cellulomonas fengjieae TaxID=2819978 RepID=UPI001AAF18AF|nr:S24/S26 family peptidase [Cellulomonas fengjieae]MBO3100737.1 S24/S26 family peptidase [Cellulomonas fengjieae]